MLNCHDATFLMSQSRERKLTFSERMKVKLHISMCRGCSNFDRQLPVLTDAVRAYIAKPDSDNV